MRRVIGIVLLLAATFFAAIGSYWALQKLGGGEVDICPEGERRCISGWYFAAALFVVAAALGVVGYNVFRGQRD